MNINNKIGIHPGTFDAITFGHLDITKRACKVVDKLMVGVAENVDKYTTFNTSLHTSMAENEVTGLGVDADVISFNGLLMNFAKEQNASIIIRGSEQYQILIMNFKWASRVNCKLLPEIETIFLRASEDTQFVSSSFVKEIAKLGNVNNFVSKSV